MCVKEDNLKYLENNFNWKYPATKHNLTFLNPIMVKQQKHHFEDF